MNKKENPISKKDTGQARTACFISCIPLISQVIYLCYNKFAKGAFYTLICKKIKCLGLSLALFMIENIGGKYE